MWDTLQYAEEYFIVGVRTIDMNITSLCRALKPTNYLNIERRSTTTEEVISVNDSNEGSAKKFTETSAVYTFFLSQ